MWKVKTELLICYLNFRHLLEFSYKLKEYMMVCVTETCFVMFNWIVGKEKSPDLDDGGTGLPPRDDDGGGGGGGGGGGWSGGFFFFGFLAFLGFLKDNEGEEFDRDRER